MQTPIYLDYAATTPVDPRVFEKMRPYFMEAFGNAHSRDHRFGWDAQQAVEEARSEVAKLINTTTSEIVFTSCATESINLALKGLCHASRDKRKAIVTTVVEHEAVLETCRQLQADLGFEVAYVPVDRNGRIDLQQLADTIAKTKPLLVSVMWANNEIGTIYPAREAAKLAHEADALFFTDATQAAGKIPIDVRADEVDLMAFSAHKLYGPKGVGGLFIHNREPRVEVAPLLNGGGQECELRSGTLNVPGIIGFGEACRVSRQEMIGEATRLAAFRNEFEERLTRSANISINGACNERLPGFSNLCFSDVGAVALLRRIDGLAASTRSACATSHPKPSHVLRSIGLSDGDVFSSIRFSLGRFTTAQDIVSSTNMISSALLR